MATASKGLQSGSNARIGLLMATRDQPRIVQAIRSLLVQTHQNFTLTIIDDGSVTPLRETLSEIGDSRITIIRQSPQGLIPSLNIAIQRGKPAAFYSVVYASCFYAPHYLATLLNQLMRHPKYSAAYCHFCEGDTGVIFKAPFFDTNALLYRDYLGPGVVFRASAFQRAGNLFLSEKRGLLETWQRMAQQVGPFLQIEDIALRWYPEPYDTPPLPPALDFEKEVYPHLKASFLVPEGQSVDSELLVLLSQSGFPLVPEQEAKARAEFVLCGNFKDPGRSFQLAQKHSATLLFSVNDRADLEALKQPANRFLLGSAHMLTRKASIAKGLQELGHTPTVYMPQMTAREVKRFLARFPGLIYRHRCVFLVRAVGGPHLLEQTLNSLNYLHRPPAFADLLIFSLDGHPETLNWLEKRQMTYFKASGLKCFEDILFLLQQLQAQYVLSIDAGILPAANFVSSLLPFLAHPRVGMVSGLMNSVRGPQRLPFTGSTLAELQQQWGVHNEQVPFQQVSLLNDGALMMRKSVLEYVLKTFPDTKPLTSDYQMSHLLSTMGYHHFLSRRTVAFNTLPY